MPVEQTLFNRGLAYDTRSALQGLGFLQAAKNITFRKDGEQSLRPAFASLNPTALSAIHSIKRFRDNLLVGHGGSIGYKSATAAGDLTALSSDRGSTPYYFKMYKGFLIAVNGTSSIMFDDYGNLYPTEIDNPSAPVGEDSGSAGNPDGTYALYVSFLITFPNGATYETGLSPASDDVTVATNKITWTTIPTSSYAALSGTEPTIHRKLYRGPGSGGALADIYWIQTISDNTTTTLSDDYSDAEVAANDASVVDDYEPGPGDFIYQEFHYGRWFGISNANPNRLYYSEAVAGATAEENESLMPIAYEDGNWDDLRIAGFGDLQTRGLIAWGTYIYIPLEHTWIKKYGNNPGTWSYKKTWANHGVAAPYSMAISDNPTGILAVSAPKGKIPGISIFNGMSTQLITMNKFEYLFKDDLNQSYVQNCRGGYDGVYYHLLYPSGTSTQPDKWAAFDLSRFPDIRLAQWEGINGRSIDVHETENSVFVGTSDGYIKQNGSYAESMDIEVHSHDLIGGVPQAATLEKNLSLLKYALDSDGESVDLEVYIDGSLAKWPDDSTTKSIRGTSDDIQVIRNFPPNFRGYKFSLRITGSNLQRFIIYSPWSIEFNTEAR